MSSVSVTPGTNGRRMYSPSANPVSPCIHANAPCTVVVSCANLPNQNSEYRLLHRIIVFMCTLWWRIRL